METIKLFHASPAKLKAGEMLKNKSEIEGERYLYLAPNLEQAYFWASWLDSKYKISDYYFYEVHIPFSQKVLVSEGGVYISWGGGVQMKASELIDLLDDLDLEAEIVVPLSLEIKKVIEFDPAFWEKTRRWIKFKEFKERERHKKRINVPFYNNKFK